VHEFFLVWLFNPAKNAIPRMRNEKFSFMKYFQKKIISMPQASLDGRAICSRIVDQKTLHFQF